MTETVETVKQRIRKAVETASGLPTIFGPSQGPEPANQYMLVTVMEIEKQEYEVSKWPAFNIEDQRGESAIKFEIQARGKNAFTYLNKVVSYFDSETRDVDLWPYVGSGGHDEIQNISAYHQGKILEAASVNMYIHAALHQINESEWFDILDISVNKSDNTHVATITVPERTEGD